MLICEHSFTLFVILLASISMCETNHVYALIHVAFEVLEILVDLNIASFGVAHNLNSCNIVWATFHILQCYSNIHLVHCNAVRS